MNNKAQQQTQYTSIGGQAIIEGVMMRSPHYVVIAVRKPDKKIVLKEFSVKSNRWGGWSEKFPILKKPFLRGIVTLVESMALGIQALNYSAQVAERFSETTADDKDNSKVSSQKLSAKQQNLMIFSTMVFAFAMGIALFVIAPHLLTIWFERLGLFSGSMSSPYFHLIDGLIKICFILTYVYLIALMKDIYRVFQYHGAEHKSIYTFEQGEELSIENARRHTTLHPRCGTSFLLFLMLISVFVFSGVLGPINQALPVEWPATFRHAFAIGLKIVLVFPIASLSYEFIRYSAKKMENPFFKVLIQPGLMLQKLTTREPADDQLEVGLISLKRALYLEKNPEMLSREEIEISGLVEISTVNANLTEFLG